MPLISHSWDTRSVSGPRLSNGIPLFNERNSNAVAVEISRLNSEWTRVNDQLLKTTYGVKIERKGKETQVWSTTPGNDIQMHGDFATALGFSTESIDKMKRDHAMAQAESLGFLPIDAPQQQAAQPIAAAGTNANANGTTMAAEQFDVKM
jgi:hypothetical protein